MTMALRFPGDSPPPAHTLRPYQEEAVAAVRKNVEETGETRFVVKVIAEITPIQPAVKVTFVD